MNVDQYVVKHQWLLNEVIQYLNTKYLIATILGMT